jgi:hypothetical protein
MVACHLIGERKSRPSRSRDGRRISHRMTGICGGNGQDPSSTKSVDWTIIAHWVCPSYAIGRLFLLTTRDGRDREDGPRYCAQHTHTHTHGLWTNRTQSKGSQSGWAWDLWWMGERERMNTKRRPVVPSTPSERAS